MATIIAEKSTQIVKRNPFYMVPVYQGNGAADVTVTNKSGSSVTIYLTQAGTDTGTSIADGSSSTFTSVYQLWSSTGTGNLVVDAGSGVRVEDVTATDDMTVTDDLTVNDALSVGGNVAVNTNKFTVDGSTGNTAVAGTLSATGDLTASAAATVGTTLGVTGVSTLTGGVAGGQATNIGTWQPISATSGTDTACTNGTAYCGSIYIPQNATVTGIQYLIGSAGGTDKVIVSLHDSTGALLANSATAGATVGSAANLQQVALTSPYAAKTGHYFVALTFNGTTAKFRTVPAYCNAGNGVIGNGVTQTFGTPADFTAPTDFTADKVPIASIY